MRLIRRMICGFLLCVPLPASSEADVSLQVTSTADIPLTAQLRGASLSLQIQDETDVTPQDVVAAAQADYARLVEALYTLGYYGPVVSIRVNGREAAQINPLATPKAVSSVEIIVDPGPAFTFGQTRIVPLAPGSAPSETFRSGAPALAGAVRDAAATSIRDWREAGHAKAKLSGQSVTARHSDALLDVSLRVDPGRQLRFGKIAVTGDTRVRASRVRQIAGLPQHEQFSPTDVEEAAQRLRATGTFRSVQVVEADNPNADGTLNMTLDVVDRKRRRLGYGFELSSTEGGTLSAYWLHRNLLGGAERFRFDAEISQLGGQSTGGTDASLKARLEKPAVHGPDTALFVQGSLDYLDEPSFQERKISLGFGVSQKFSKHLVGEVGLTVTRTEITDLFLPVTASGAHPKRTLNFLSLPSALTWDTRDTALDATSGVFAKLNFEPFTGSGGVGSGAQLKLDARTYHAVGQGAETVLAARFQLGALVGPQAVDAPPAFLFFSGGGGSVRGQPYQSLGTTTGATPLGGRSFVGLSGEVRQSITDTISAVGFADAGYIGGESFYDGSGNWHSGAGLGLRYDTSVGPIRLDVAAPLGGTTGDGIQFYIGIGQAF